MCGPAAGPLLIASTAVSALGSIAGGMQAQAQGRYQAQIAKQNAALANEAAAREAERTQDEARDHYRRVAALKGQQRVAAAANGVTVDYGTAATVLDDTDLMANEDLRRIYGRGAEAQRGFDIEAANFNSQAQASRQRGDGALVGSFFEAGSTALGGASQYSRWRAGR